MPQTIKYDRNHSAGGTAEARIASRLKNSGVGGDRNVVTPDQTVTTGSGSRRVHTNIHTPGGAQGGTNKAENNR
jgi:hypothetical protein